MAESFYDKSRIHAENADQLRRSGHALLGQKKYTDSAKEYKAALRELDLERAELEKIPASDLKHYADEVRMNIVNRASILGGMMLIYYDRADLEKGNNRIIALNEALAKSIAARDLLASLPEPRKEAEQEDLNDCHKNIIHLLSGLKQIHTENTERLRHQGRALLQEKNMMSPCSNLKRHGMHWKKKARHFQHQMMHFTKRTLKPIYDRKPSY